MGEQVNQVAVPASFIFRADDLHHQGFTNFPTRGSRWQARLRERMTGSG
jgi:hypothetical protein